MANVFNASTSSALVMSSDTSGAVQFQTNGTPTVTIDTIGNVGVGTTTPLAVVGRTLEVTGTTYSFNFVSDATGTVRGQMYADNANGLVGMGSRTNQSLILVTNNTERARIDTSGNLLVGTTSSTTTNVGARILSSTTTPQIAVGVSATSNNYILYNTTAVAYRLYVSDAGQIYATNTSISAISDATLKTNIRDIDTGLTQIMALKPRRFDWLNGDGTNVAGFISQEVEEVLPDLVTESIYSHDENGGDIHKKFLKMGDMIPTMVKAIQELSAQVTELKAEVALLKGV